PTDHDAEDFIPRGTAVQGGQACSVLRTEPSGSSPSLKDEFWIGQGTESSIVRHVYYNGSNPWFLLDVKSRANEGTWLPEKWEMTHSRGGKVVKAYRLIVKSFELNPVISD